MKIIKYQYMYTCNVCEDKIDSLDDNLPQGWSEYSEQQHVCSKHEIINIINEPCCIIKNKDDDAMDKLIILKSNNNNLITQTQAQEEIQIQEIPDDFVLIPSGELNGVKIDEFYMCKFCVTEEQYRGEVGNKKPAVNISYCDAIAYCDVLFKETGTKYRLPTSEEWEYACRAGTITEFNTGDKLPIEQANFNSNGVVDVDSYNPNIWGLYCIHGNVWEWTSTETALYRVLRGGSWGSDARGCRSAYRYGYDPSYRDISVGVRLVIDK